MSSVSVAVWRLVWGTLGLVGGIILAAKFLEAVDWPVWQEFLSVIFLGMIVNNIVFDYLRRADK